MDSKMAIRAIERAAQPRPLGRMISLLGWLGALIFAAAAFVSTAHGQAAYLGTVNGTVTDQTGAAIVGAQIQIIDEVTHFVSPATTNGSGLYSMPYLTPDTYDVKVQAKGFAGAEQTGAVLIANGVKEIDFKLSPAAANATVTVIANDQLIDTESATLQTVLTSNIVHNSPNIDGNVYMMSTRVAGIYSNFTQNTETSEWDPQGGGISGSEVGTATAGNQLVTMNGINELVPRGTPGLYTGYVPPAIAVQELNVQTAPYDAAVGHTMGGVQGVVAKTGTEKFHSELAFMYGDRIFNSNYDNRTGDGQSTKISDTWSQPNFVVTGPVIIPKLWHSAHPRTFFMASYQHIQSNIASYTSFSGNMPTVKERAGDFSELSAAGTAAGKPMEGVIYDPTTTVPTGAPLSYAPWCAGLTGGCTAGLRETFTQEYNEGPSNTTVCGGDTNCIPTTRFNPTGLALLAYYPQPTSISPTLPGTGNFAPDGGISAPYIYWMGAFEVDQEFNDNNKLKLLFLPYRAWDLQAGDDFPFVNGFTGGAYDNQYQYEWGGLADYTKIISPTMVLDVRLGGTYSPFTQNRPGDHMPLSTIGMTGNTATFPYPNFPQVSASGPFGSYTALNSGAGNFWYASEIDGHAELSKTFQRHNVKTGFEYMLTRDDYQDPESAIANSSNPFNFNFSFTNSNAGLDTANNAPAVDGGDGIAALLLGYPSSGAATIQPAPNVQYDYWAGFLQDDWRLTHKLTLNLGLRYEYYSPYTERHNGMEAGFNASSTQPFNLPNAAGTGIASSVAPPASAAVPQGYTGGLYFVNTAAYPSRQDIRKTMKDGFGPRIGASYVVFRNTVLRGGFAVFLAPNAHGVDVNGYTATTSLDASNNSYATPPTCTAAQNADAYGFCNLTNPYPNPFVVPTGNLLGLSTGLGSSLAVAGPVFYQIKSRIWSVGIEQQLPLNMVVDVEYHGNLENGAGISKNFNALPNCYYDGYTGGGISGQFVVGGCANAGNATALGATVTNPMAGYMPSSSGLNAAKVPQSDLYLPYPEFTTITQTVTALPGTNHRIGQYIENALYVTVTKRTSHGLEFHTAFTYQYVENRATLENAGDPLTGQIPKEFSSQPDRYLVGDIVYNTPKLNVNRALGYVVNDWRWSHSLNWQAGVSTGIPGSSFLGPGPETTTHQSLTHWFNTCYIPVVTNGNVGQTLNGVVNTAPVYGPPTNCQFGEQPAWIQQPTQTLNQTTGQSIRDVRLQEIPYYDMALEKMVHVRERFSLSFRVEAHNVFNNSLNGTGPSTSLTSSSFGVNTPYATAPNGTPIYTEVNDPRVIRLEGRFSF